MSVRNKIYLPEQTYFITFTILGWRKIFVNDHLAGLVYKWFDYLRTTYDNQILGYVIMPNHVHCLLKTSAKSPGLPILVMNAKRFLAYEIIDYLKQVRDKKTLDYFAWYARVQDRAQHKVFTDGYASLIIQSEKMFLQKLNYIHKNPCQEKWQLAKSPEEYRYSSAANYTYGHGYYEVSLVDF